MELRGQNVEVGYHRCAVVTGVNFCAEQNQLIALMGLNGSGKSTLLHSLAGLLPLLGGEIALNGKNLHQWLPEERARHISVVTTGRLETGNMTAFDVAAMGRYPYTGLFGKLGSDDEEIVCAALMQCGLEKLSGRIFSTLSDGEKQRVLIARALAQQTAVILLDEPTSYLDVRGKAEVFDLLSQLATGRIIVFSTHEVDLAPKVASHFWLIGEDRQFNACTAAEAVSNQLLQRLFHPKAI